MVNWSVKIRQGSRSPRPLCRYTSEPWIRMVAVSQWDWIFFERANFLFWAFKRWTHSETLQELNLTGKTVANKKQLWTKYLQSYTMGWDHFWKFSLGLYWTSRPVRKSEKLSKSRLAGNRTSRKPDVFFSGGRTFKTYGNDKIFKKKKSKIKIVFFKFVSVNWCKFSIQIHSMYQSRSHPIVNSFRKEVKVGR